MTLEYPETTERMILFSALRSHPSGITPSSDKALMLQTLLERNAVLGIMHNCKPARLSSRPEQPYSSRYEGMMSLNERQDVFEPEAGVKFWNLALFKTSKRFVWDVIGATNFAPVNTHAVGRFQRWSYDGVNIEEQLRRVLPDLKKRAKDQGAAAFWLLHSPEEKLIGIQLAFPKAQSAEPPSIGIESLAAAANQVSLGGFFPVYIRMKKVVDWTSLFLAIWLPRSRLEGGVPYSSPMYPTLPDVQEK
jgi:hypothetical protein